MAERASHTTGATPTDTKAFAIEAAQLLADRRCEDIRLLNVMGLSQVCNYLLIASGTSERQMKSVAHEVADAGEEQNHHAFRRNADTSNTWVVIDFVDLVVHLFEPNIRRYYDLETLWMEATRIDWRRPDQQAHHRFEGEIGLSVFDDGHDEASPE